MADSNINISINVMNKQAERALKGFGNQADKARKKADELGGAAKRTSQTFSVFGGVLAAGIVQRGLSALTDGFAVVAGEALQFSRALKEIETILPGNAKVTDRLRRQLSELSVEFGTSKTEQAKTFYQIVSSGTTDAAQATRLLVAANKLSLGGLADVQSSVNVLTDILNVYGSENINAAEAADSLFTAVRLGKTTVSQLSSSLGKALPLAQSLGVSFDEVASATATLTTKGLSTAERVTQLNALFTSLLRAQEKVKKESQDVANAFSLTALESKGLSGFLKGIIDATGGSEAELQRLLGTTEAVQAVLGLTGDDLAAFNSNLGQFEGKAGAADAAAEKMRNTLDFQLDQLTQNFVAFGSALIEDMEPALVQATKAVNGFFSSLLGSPKTVEGVNTQIAELEARIADVQGRLEGEEGFLQKIFGGVDEGASEAMNAELERLQTRLKDLKQTRDELAGEGEGGSLVGDPEKAKQDANQIVETKKAQIEKIKELEEQKRLSDEEVRLAQEEFKNQKEQADFQKLVERVGREKAIKLQAEQAIIDAKKKSTEEKTRLTEQELKVEIAANKKAVQDAQMGYNARVRAYREKNQILTEEEGALVNTLTRLQQSGNKELFRVGQAASIAKATINTYEAATAALAQGGPFLGPALAAAITAAGFVQVRNIASQQPRFEDGGIVPGTSFTGDRVQARVNSGEMILNRSQQSNLFRQINEGEGGGSNRELLGQILNAVRAKQNVSVQVDGKEIIGVVRDELDAGRSFA